MRDRTHSTAREHILKTFGRDKQNSETAEITGTEIRQGTKEGEKKREIKEIKTQK